MWQLVRGVWRNGWMVVTVVISAVVISFLRSTLQAKLWSSTSEVRVLNPSSVSVLPHQNEVNPAREVALQAIFAQSATVTQGAQIRLGREASTIDSVTISGDPTANGIQFDVISASRPAAQKAADAYADAYIEARRKDIGNVLAAQVGKLHDDSSAMKNQIADLDKQLADIAPQVVVNSTGNPVVAPESEPQKALRSNREALATRAEETDKQASLLAVESSVRQLGISVVEPAPWPDVPVQPTPLRDVAVAAGLGMVLGLSVAASRTRRDDRIRTADDTEDLIPEGVVVVAVPRNPAYPDKGDQSLLRLEENGSREREAYRALRTMLFFGHDLRRGRRIVVTSPNQGDGKTSTAANLAVSVATSGATVALVDCDLRRPRLHAVLDLPNHVGLASLVGGRASLQDALTSVDLPGSHRIDVLTAGPISDSPAELVMSVPVGLILSRLAEHYDFVICDSSPLRVVADALPLAGSADGAVIVVRAGSTRKSELSNAIAQLNQVSGNIVAVVISQVKANNGRYTAPCSDEAEEPSAKSGPTPSGAGTTARHGAAYTRFAPY